MWDVVCLAALAAMGFGRWRLRAVAWAQPEASVEAVVAGVGAESVARL